VRGLIATKAFILWGFMGVELDANVLGIVAALNMPGQPDSRAKAISGIMTRRWTWKYLRRKNIFNPVKK